ncbi:MAG: dTDP-4-dehydrorhamnose 3,5-epimerase [Ignavibacteria bacterium]|nr:dTDP-4-dehydrorhamnose 3,5-epimerase [Ignavibacteria bacterium]
MEFIKTKLDGVLILKPKVYPDDRGYFFESYNEKNFFGEGLYLDFVQDNISFSKKGTIRGLHYQVGENAQGKLCQVLSGKVIDVAVDIRFGSPTFGEHVAVELSDENHNQIWIPPGFAHGFSVLSDTAIFHYKCTAFYSKKDERAILFNDSDLNIDWKVDALNISEKDLKGNSFKDIGKDFLYTD